jgi:hypothetical protein
MMTFRCCDCEILITGKEILDGYYLTIVRRDSEDPIASDFRCESCQDDYEDAFLDALH